MKTIIKYWPLALMLLLLSSCTVSQSEWDEIIPLPEADTGIGIDPWQGEDSGQTLE